MSELLGVVIVAAVELGTCASSLFAEKKGKEITTKTAVRNVYHHMTR